MRSRWPVDPSPDPSPCASARDARSFEQCVDDAERAVRTAIRREMVSDRPVGVFLSGGVDSSLIASEMVRVADGPVKSFAAGFDDPSLDEARHAEAVARTLGLDHVTLRVTATDALDALEAIGDTFDEPLSDMAALPTWLLARRARREVGVVLTGDGGDEAFAGYGRYQRLAGAVGLAGRMPVVARRLGQVALSGPWLPISAWLAVALGRATTRPAATAALRRLADTLDDPTRARLYRSLMTLWPDADRLVGVVEPLDDALERADRIAVGPLDFAQRADLASYLPEALFVKTDRTTMAHGLEARVPLAARDVIDVGLGLPEAMRHHGGRSKAVLRAVAERRIDRGLIDRPKQGFSVPMAAWLRGPLRDWAEGLIGGPALKAAGLFDADRVGARWRAHQSGDVDFSYSLWAILMAQAFARGKAAGGRDVVEPKAPAT